jgi:hypothetical protein
MVDQITTPQKGDADYVDYVVNLAQGRVMRDGIITEPRAIFDQVTVDPTGLETAGNPGVFINGEQFPLRLTHMLAAVRHLNNADPQAVDDQRNIQRIGLRMIFHDQFYMNRQFLPLPVWGNKVVAASDVVSFDTSAWDFVANGQPFVLSARDTLQVTVQLNGADPGQGEGRAVNVVVTGFGMLSKRPYVLNGQVTLEDLVAINLSTVDFRNDGSEPIVITDMTANISAAEDADDPRGDISELSLNIKQIGNGTNAAWFRGPATPINLPNMPAQLCGVTSGRAVVHEIPGDGLIWEPGEGITIEAQRLGTAPFSSVLVLAFIGYTMIV